MIAPIPFSLSVEGAEMWGATLDGEGNSIKGAKGSKAGTPRSEKEVALTSISNTISGLRVAVYVMRLNRHSISCFALLRYSLSLATDMPLKILLHLNL